MWAARLKNSAKRIANRALRPFGAEVLSVRAERDEDARLQKLVESGHWNSARFASGLAWQPQQFRGFLEEICRPWASAYSRLPGNAAEANGGYHLNNGWFDSVDAEVLYSVIRHFKPKRIIEVGSGNSTKLMRRAISDGELSTTITCIDPHPRADVRSFCDEHRAIAVEHVEISSISDQLSSGDILFIDSSHIIRTGGDVTYLYLEVLPRLQRGVLLHAHDIFLPFEYPQEVVVNEKWGWTEQYLLNALLYASSRFEVLWPSCFMWTRDREFVEQIFPSRRTYAPSSLWFVEQANSTTGTGDGD